MHNRNLLETVLEQTLFKSRWLLAPFYLGLVVSLAMLLAALSASWCTGFRRPSTSPRSIPNR